MDVIVEEIEGFQIELGKSQGYVPLPIRIEMMVDVATGDMTPAMTMQVRPTPEMITHLLNNGSLFVRLLGINWPPINVMTSAPYDKAAADAGWAYFRRAKIQQEMERDKQIAENAVAMQKQSISNKARAAIDRLKNNLKK